MMPVPSEFIHQIYFSTPNTPDLGCFVRRDHEFQVDSPNFHLWAEPPPFDQNFNYLPHQVYFRVKCGEAAFFQRCHVRMRNTWNPTIVLASPPDWTLGGYYPVGCINSVLPANPPFRHVRPRLSTHAFELRDEARCQLLHRNSPSASTLR